MRHRTYNLIESSQCFGWFVVKLNAKTNISERARGGKKIVPILKRWNEAQTNLLYALVHRRVLFIIYSVFFCVAFVLFFLILFLLCNYNLFWCLSKNTSSAHALDIFQVSSNHWKIFFLCLFGWCHTLITQNE